MTHKVSLWGERKEKPDDYKANRAPRDETSILSTPYPSINLQYKNELVSGSAGGVPARSSPIITLSRGPKAQYYRYLQPQLYLTGPNCTPCPALPLHTRRKCCNNSQTAIYSTLFERRGSGGDKRTQNQFKTPPTATFPTMTIKR